MSQLVTDKKSHAYANVDDVTGETNISTRKDEQMMDHSEVRDVQPSKVMEQVQREQNKDKMQPSVPIDIYHQDNAYEHSNVSRVTKDENDKK